MKVIYFSGMFLSLVTIWDWKEYREFLICIKKGALLVLLMATHYISEGCRHSSFFCIWRIRDVE